MNQNLENQGNTPENIPVSAAEKATAITKESVQEISSAEEKLKEENDAEKQKIHTLRESLGSTEELTHAVEHNVLSGADTQTVYEVKKPAKEMGDKGWRKIKNFFMGGLTALSMAIPASSKAEDGKQIKNKSENKTEVSARKVDKIPPAYTFEKIENGKKIYRYDTRSELPQAKSGGKKGGDDYENWVKSKLAQGVTPEEMAEKGYISKETISTYAPFYKVDRVYTEEEPKNPETVKDNPFDGYERAKLNGSIFDFNHHIAAEIWYPTRNSVSIKDGGTTNTSVVEARIFPRDDWGYKKDSKGKIAYIDLTDEELRKYFDGVNTIQTIEKTNELMARAGVAETK